MCDEAYLMFKEISGPPRLTTGTLQPFFLGDRAMRAGVSGGGRGRGGLEKRHEPFLHSFRRSGRRGGEGWARTRDDKDRGQG